MTKQSIFDATPSALGYIYQVRYALYLALKKIGEVNDPDECFISIEKLDDIAFEEAGTSAELLQTKYHGNPGNITDRSEDLWKTIRVWSEMVKIKDVRVENIEFTLLTTETAPVNSIAYYLGTDENVRNIKSALSLMQAISQEKNNKANKISYSKFSDLEVWQQESLLSATYIISKSPNILDVENNIKKQARLSVSANHINAFTSRLEGLWFKRVIEVMSSFDQKNSINLGELVNFVDDLRVQFLPSNLPSDYDEINPEEMDIENDDRLFVQQLRLISANNSIIRNAIVNYYRAFEQRSRWSREGLVKPGEIQKYLNRLKNEWENQTALMELAHDISNEMGQIEAGKQLYIKCQNDCALPIRTAFQSSYVARGSFHTLSESREIGWHPNYIDLLSPVDKKGVA